MSYKAHMHGGGKSSDCIVPTKCANKGGGPSEERMEGRRSAEETSRHGPMLDTAPENIGALQCRGNACSRYRLGAERSEVGTVCVKRASTGLCGGQPATAVPTATSADSRRVAQAGHRHRRNQREQVPGALPQAAVPNLADLPLVCVDHRLRTSPAGRGR